MTGSLRIVVVATTILCLSTTAWAASLANLSMPSIRGRVLASGSQDALPGVELLLYTDDGNRVFDANDQFTGVSSSSDDAGGYQFAGLDPAMSYFVMLPEQVAGGKPLLGGVSELESPGLSRMVIDSFDITQTVVVDPLSRSRSGAVAADASMILGRQRDVYLEITGGSADAKLRVNPYSLSSNLQFDASAGVTAMAVLTWDGVDASAGMNPGAGLAGMDFTSGGLNDGLLLRMGVDEAGAGQTVKLMLYSDQATKVSTAEVLLPVTGNGDPSSYVYLPLTEFQGEADATRVDALQLVLDASRPSIDAQIDEIGLVGPTRVDITAIVVPEPLILPSALATVLALLTCSRRNASARRRS